MKKIKILTIITGAILTAQLSHGESKLTGLDVIKKVYYRPVGKDMKSTLTMKLIGSSGSVRVRKIRQFSRDFGRVEKKIMFFISPADVKNTSFMNWSYDRPSKSDDQWIYLPAIKKVKRISSDSKSDYFMGSDFTYDDLGDRHPNMDTHKIIREETFEGENCYVVESRPKDKDYMYSKTISWVIKGKWIGLQKKFYDEDGNYLKVLKVKSYKKIKGYRIVVHSEMKNVQKNHTTEMILQNVRINSGVSSRKFTERMMRRGL